MGLAVSYSAPVQPNDPNYWGSANVTTTHLPPNTALVRAVAIMAIAAYICIKIVVWCWPVLVISSIYALWTIYANMIRKDPFVEKFYEICGGKDKYEQLPNLPLPHPSSPLGQNIKSYQWEDLKHPAYQAKTTDGRQVLIMKALSKENDKDYGLTCKIKSIFAFVEKLGPADSTDKASNLSPENTRRFMTFIDACTFKGNDAGSKLCSHRARSGYLKDKNFEDDSRDTFMFSSISDQLARELRL